jgi:hypothetical protein
MKRRITVLTAFAMCLAVVGALAGVNFSGTWELDPAKSDAPQTRGGGPGGGPGGGGGGQRAATLTIKQTDNEFVVTRTTPRGDMESKYTLDGKENSNPMPFGRGGQSTMKSKSKWSKDTLVIDGSGTVSTPNGEFDISIKTEYSLSADGKVLTITTTRSTPQGDNTSKQVYNKK